MEMVQCWGPFSGPQTFKKKKEKEGQNELKAKNSFASPLAERVSPFALSLTPLLAV